MSNRYIGTYDPNNPVASPRRKDRGERPWSLKNFFFRRSNPIPLIPPTTDTRKTLVLDLDETLIHSSDIPPHSSVEYFMSGNPQFYVYKRPGLDEFLQFASERFEIIIFTYGEQEYAEPVLDVLCPFVDKDHRLYRDACDMQKGIIKKDIRLVNRPLSGLILVDDSNCAIKTNPDNTIIIPRWLGSPRDTALTQWLPPILERCYEAEDVRNVICTIPACQKVRRFTNDM